MKQDRIEALRKIVNEKQYAKVDGMFVDVFTASTIVSVYDKGGPGVKRVIKNLPLEKVVRTCYRISKGSK